MVCEHLAPIEEALLHAHIPVLFRGQAWSDNCREWVYFDCWLDLSAIRVAIEFDPCVVDHQHRGTHDGSERGLVCSRCHDAVMGHFAHSHGQRFFAG